MSQRLLARFRDMALVVLLVASLVFLAWAYNYLKISGEHVLRDFIEQPTSVVLTGLLALVSVVASIFMARYAHETVDEMRNDRRKDTTEKKLEKVYSPLYGILQKAKGRGSGREWLSNARRADWPLGIEEVGEIEKMFMTYRHYFSLEKATVVGQLLEQNKIQENKTRVVSGWYYLFKGSDMDGLLKYVESEYRRLNQELRRLAETP